MDMESSNHVAEDLEVVMTEYALVRKEIVCTSLDEEEMLLMAKEMKVGEEGNNVSYEVEEVVRGIGTKSG